MRKDVRLFSLVAALFLAGTAAAQPVEGSLTYTLYRNYLIVAQGSVGPLAGLHFLVDTGASPTIIDTRIAHRLHLQEESAELRTVAGPSVATRTVVPRLQVGPAWRDDLPVMVKDLSFLSEVLPLPIDGIVGLDVLGQAPFIIDYRDHVILFGKLPTSADALPFILQDGLAIVHAEVNGTQAEMLLDTAAPSLILFAKGRGDGKMPLRSLRLGSSDFNRAASFILAGRTSPGAGFDGLLSPAAVGIRSLAIDYAGRKAIFSP